MTHAGPEQPFICLDVIHSVINYTVLHNLMFFCFCMFNKSTREGATLSTKDDLSVVLGEFDLSRDSDEFDTNRFSHSLKECLSFV